MICSTPVKRPALPRICPTPARTISAEPPMPLTTATRFTGCSAQIGTDTTPESGKMNLNYDNLDPFVTVVNGNLVTNAPAATNFMAWTPLAFFTNAADRMLKDYTTRMEDGLCPHQWRRRQLLAVVNTNFVATFNVTNAFGVTGIPVWVSNRFVYTPAVQRVLQLAANIYDASTTNYYPSVFRPCSPPAPTGMCSSPATPTCPPSRIPPSLRGPLTPRPCPPCPPPPISTIWPRMFMACRGSLARRRDSRTSTSSRWRMFSRLTRKLQLTRPSTNVNYSSNPGAYTISQQLTISMTNMFGVECWNSYQADYTNAAVEIVVKDCEHDDADQRRRIELPHRLSPSPMPRTVFDWPGYGPSLLYPNPQSFIYAPLEKGEIRFAQWIYTFDSQLTPFVAQAPSYFVTNSLMPHWSLLVTNRLQVVMLESNAADRSYHVIDYVQLIGPENSVDLTAAITNLYDTYYDKNNNYQKTTDNGYNDMWDPTVNNGWPMGIAKQLSVSVLSYPDHPFSILESVESGGCDQPDNGLSRVSRFGRTIRGSCPCRPLTRPRRRLPV